MLPEPVTIVTTIVGLTGFTVTALTTIDKLRLFWRDLNDEAVHSFLHDLEVSEALLKEVQDLCIRLKRDGTTQLPGIRMGTLNIHVEDYGQDLQEWLRISLQFASRRLSKRTGLEVEQEPPTEPPTKPPKFRKNAFGNFLHAVRKASRSDVRSSVQWHQENIKLSLSLLTVNLALTQQEELKHVSGAIGTLEQLSSSGSSVLALSLTHEERLKDVQSNISNLSERLGGLEKVLQWMSSRDSEASSSAGDGMNKRDSRDMTGVGGEGEAASKVAKSKDQDPGMTVTNDIPSSSSISNSDQGPPGPVETQMLLDVSRDACETISRVIHPVIAEYIATRAAWGLLHSQRLAVDLQRSLIKQEDNIRSDGQVRNIERKFTVAARRLLSLRKACHYEDLDETLALVDKRLKISQRDVDRWIVIAQGLSKKHRQLNLNALDFATPSERLEYRITYLNAWMYEVKRPFSHLTELHRLIFEEIQGHANQRAWEVEYLPQTISGKDNRSGRLMDLGISKRMDSATLARETLKYWLLDMAAIPNNEYASSSVGDSEATFRQYESEAAQTDDDKDLVPIQNAAMLKQPPTPRGWDSLMKKTLDRCDNLVPIDLPAASVSAGSAASAQEALEEYRSEPNGLSWIYDVEFSSKGMFSVMEDGSKREVSVGEARDTWLPSI